jgi:hypothetical protein
MGTVKRAPEFARWSAMQEGSFGDQKMEYKQKESTAIYLAPNHFATGCMGMGKMIADKIMKRKVGS